MTAEKSTSSLVSELLSATHTVTELIRTRHSARAFQDAPVPKSILEECFFLAQHAPSNSNLQPWRVHVLEGPALKRLTVALQAAVDDNIPQAIAPIPEVYKHYRSEMGHKIYGEEGYGIARGDREGMEKARRRNYDFFGAPVGMVIYIDSALAAVDVLAVGLWLQTFCILLEERGVESCIQVSVAGYPDVIRKQLGIPENMNILCGLAVGFEDKTQSISKMRVGRDDWKNGVVFVTE